MQNSVQNDMLIFALDSFVTLVLQKCLIVKVFDTSRALYL